MLLLYAFALSILFLLACIYTYISTTIRFRRAIHRPHSPPLPPPTLPHLLPYVGHAPSFLSRTPGSFFRSLQHTLSAVPASGAKAITISLPSLPPTHILTSPDLVRGLFAKSTSTVGHGGHVSRDRFTRDVMVKAMGLGREDAELVFGSGSGNGWEEREAGIHAKWLLGKEGWEGIGRRFWEFLNDELCADEVEVRDVELYSWLRERMFAAGTAAVMGRRILQMNPGLSKLYWEFDAGVMVRMFGLPRWLNWGAYRALEVLVGRVEEWVEAMRDEGVEKVGVGVEWEPLMGSRLMRERHRMYAEQGLSLRGRACFDVGFLFGLNSNSIPATGWLLFHLLSPTNTHALSQIQTELESIKRPDGSIDMPTLMSLPYLNSAFHETLRLYIDFLVTREVQSDLMLDRHVLKKGDVIIAPSFLGHRDPIWWSDGDMVREDVWYAERFLKHDEGSGRTLFSTSGTAGKFFPFGGGLNICPGRVFAKWEVFAAVASILLNFEAEFIEYVDTHKRDWIFRKVPAAFPSVKKQYAGNGVITMEGDLRMRLKRRK